MQQTARSDDTIHRRPDFMAHDREELGTRTGTGFCRIACGREFAFGPFLLRNICESPHHVASRQNGRPDFQHGAIGTRAFVDHVLRIGAANAEHEKAVMLLWAETNTR